MVHRSRFKTRRVWIRVSPRRELRHLALRLAIPATKINPLVSPPDPHEWHQYLRGSLFLSHQLRVSMTSEARSALRKHREVRADMSTLLALADRTPVAKGVREGTSHAGVESDTERKFGPLKVVLESIPPLYANHEVRLKISAQASPLTNTLTEDHRCEQKNRKPPLARSFFGRMFRFASH